MANTTGKIVDVMFEETLETYEQQTDMLNMVKFNEPDPTQFQRAGDVEWVTVQQHAPIIEGTDLSSTDPTNIIKETYPRLMGTLKNDWVTQSISDSRDMSFWRERGQVSGKRQALELQKSTASAIATQGSLFYRSNVTSGYDFIAEAQAMMNERQLPNNKRHFMLNDRTQLKYAKDLASRETLAGRPEGVWKTGMIGSNVAEFDVYTGSFLPNITGGASPGTDTTAAYSGSPEAGSVVTSTGVVTNVDYRVATLAVTASANYTVGDKVYFTNTGTPVYALGKADKTATGQIMTFTIVAKPSATSVKIYPKPIAADDSSLTTLEAAYANVNTQIASGAVMVRLNTAATEKTNLFWDKSAVEITGGVLPANLFSELSGLKVISQRMSNGLTMYMVYDGNIATLSFRYRLFTWYGITIADPSNCGVATAY